MEPEERVSQLALPEDRSSDWAWKQFKTTVLTLAEQSGSRRILEIGGGRRPLFSVDEVQQYRFDYTINDVDQQELERAPEGYRKACFDSAGVIPEELVGNFDLIFSKMVLEHVGNGQQYFQNVCQLLAPGGVGIAFHPTLYCPPFVVNRLLPEDLSARILRFFFPYRNPEAVPKFPARYSWCFSTQSHVQRVRELGFQDVVIVPFYGTRYFSKIPGLATVDRALTRLARKRDVRWVSSFAFTLTFR
jgi:SAM-dependent methyltransferase